MVCAGRGESAYSAEKSGTNSLAAFFLNPYLNEMSNSSKGREWTQGAGPRLVSEMNRFSLRKLKHTSEQRIRLNMGSPGEGAFHKPRTPMTDIHKICTIFCLEAHCLSCYGISFYLSFFMLLRSFLTISRGMACQCIGPRGPRTRGGLSRLCRAFSGTLVVRTVTRDGP